jgi:hypothetical protein
MIEAITAFLTSNFDVTSDTAQIIAVSLRGLAILAVCAGIGWFLAKVGEGLGSAFDSGGQGLGAFLQGLGMIPAGFGDALKSIGVGIAKFLGTFDTMANKAAEVRIAEINAQREVFDMQVTDGKGRSVGLKLSGEGANRAAREVVSEISGPSRAVFGNSAVRVLTNNRTGDEE